MKKKISVVATNACGWPNLTKLKNGQILCTYFNAPSHGLMQGDLVCSISNRNGLNWRKRGVVAKHPKDGNRMHLAVGMAVDGDLVWGRGNPSETWMVSSEDDGKTWNKISKFGSNDSNEATLCSLGENRVLAAVRTHVDHHVKLCEIKLTGKWKEKGPLTLPMQHPADVIKLSDNCLLLTYGIRNRGLMGIGARLSIDGGKSWRPPWVIHQFGNEAKDIGYPSTVALDKKGTLLTAFYTDYESTLIKKPNMYRVLSMRWSLKDWLHPTILGSISDGKQLKL